jgi:hypothetical protein
VLCTREWKQAELTAEVSAVHKRVEAGGADCGGECCAQESGRCGRARLTSHGKPTHQVEALGGRLVDAERRAVAGGLPE